MDLKTRTPGSAHGLVVELRLLLTGQSLNNHVSVNPSAVIALWVESRRSCPSTSPSLIFFHTKPGYEFCEDCLNLAVPHGDTNPVMPFFLTEFLNHEE